MIERLEHNGGPNIFEGDIWGQLPDARVVLNSMIRDCKEISTRARCLGWAINSFSSSELQSKAGQDKLAKLIGVRKSEIKILMHELVQAGLFVAEKIGKAKNSRFEYTGVIDPETAITLFCNKKKSERRPAKRHSVIGSKSHIQHESSSPMELLSIADTTTAEVVPYAEPLNVVDATRSSSQNRESSSACGTRRRSKNIYTNTQPTEFHGKGGMSVGIQISGFVGIRGETGAGDEPLDVTPEHPQPNAHKPDGLPSMELRQLYAETFPNVHGQTLVGWVRDFVEWEINLGGADNGEELSMDTAIMFFVDKANYGTVNVEQAMERCISAAYRGRIKHGFKNFLAGTIRQIAEKHGVRNHPTMARRNPRGFVRGQSI